MASIIGGLAVATGAAPTGPAGGLEPAVARAESSVTADDMSNGARQRRQHRRC
jgi:hypothetical protein